MNRDIALSYGILSNIYFKGAYSSIEITRSLENVEKKDRIVRIVYGVLDRDVELDYYVDALSRKSVKSDARLIIKIAIYCIVYMDNIPNYAAVDNAVDLCRHINRREYTGFVNAVLKRFIDEGVKLPTREYESLSVTLSKPLWLVKSLIKQYGREEAVKIMSYEGDTREHVRPNTRRMSYDELTAKLREKKIRYIESGVGGAFVDNCEYIRKLFDKGSITIQGKSSVMCVQAMGVEEGDVVLDLCSAPGGKAVYIEEIAKDVSVTANELHEHRAELIKSYARRMGARLEVTLFDATLLNAAWMGKFDKVLADVPCSGLGVMHKKGDVLLGKTPEDIESLSNIQYAILNNAIEYAKSGGAIIYSTCTILREENYNIVGRLLKERNDIFLEKIEGLDIENNGSIQILTTNTYGADGFFVAKLRKR